MKEESFCVCEDNEASRLLVLARLLAATLPFAKLVINACEYVSRLCGQMIVFITGRAIGKIVRFGITFQSTQYF
jgi:hypothetical protein